MNKYETSKQALGGMTQWLFRAGTRKCYLLRRGTRAWDYGCGYASDVTLRRAGTASTRRLAMSFIDSHLEARA